MVVTFHSCPGFVERNGVNDTQQNKRCMINTSKHEVEVFQVYSIDNMDVRLTGNASVHNSHTKWCQPYQWDTGEYHMFCDVLPVLEWQWYRNTALQSKWYKIQNAGDVRKLLEGVTDCSNVIVSDIEAVECCVERVHWAEYGTVEDVDKHLIEEKNVW